jgi:type II secretory pathway component PulF
MHQYRYEAEGKDGQVIRGVVTAPNLAAARDDVESKLLLPLKVLEVPDERPARASRRPGMLLAWR